MREDERFQIIWENAQKMPEMEKAVFFELERKKTVAGLLLVVFLFGGAGLIYAEKAAKGAVLMLIDAALIAAFLTLHGFGPIDIDTTFDAASLILVPLILALYIYSAWDVRRTIEEHNNRLYATVFDRSPP
ncbi:hypothetical protein [Methanocrinis sp.]|uniref:hypothetical protein n=1 Tax=Methanocrinis sp. TaxID=3101522 RepID=UPI003D0D718F